jgi:hypothetical protein
MVNGCGAACPCRSRRLDADGIGTVFSTGERFRYLARRPSAAEAAGLEPDTVWRSVWFHVVYLPPVEVAA